VSTAREDVLSRIRTALGEGRAPAAEIARDYRRAGAYEAADTPDALIEKLVDRLESLRAFSTGYVPPLTYGPTRRLGARGAYVVRLDLKEKRLVPEGGWVEVE